jgi:8-oxo-dGTP diphosphatase
MTSELGGPVIEAAGGVVERDTAEGVRIAVIYRERYGGEWGLPKGKREASETWQATALREVQEELGLSPTIVGVVGATAYLARGTPKLVLYWRMRVEGDVPPFAPNEEVKEVAWLTLEEAAERLTHREEANLIRACMN